MFIEHDEGWRLKVLARVRHADIRVAHYWTRRRDWKQCMTEGDRLTLDLPSDLLREKWDIVLVDAPPGEKEEDQGRMQSIYTSLSLITAESDIFLHDCDREVERACADHWFGGRFTHTTTGRMRHYRALPDSGVRER